MIDWIIVNKEWLFSGLGLFILGLFIREYGIRKWKKGLKTNSERDKIYVRKKSFTSYLPIFIIRLIYKPEKIVSKINIDFRSFNAINFKPNSEMPKLSIWFKITNLSFLDIELDRMILDIWFGQPTCNGAMLNRHYLPAGEITEGIFFETILNTKQEEKIKRFIDDSKRSGQLHLNIKAYFESRAGKIEVIKRIERNSIK
ncbi:MAG: hypothetical protein PVG39_03780 [Desulfobacteraceae bacterium]|jgi:hypothetical protein